MSIKGTLANSVDSDQMQQNFIITLPSSRYDVNAFHYLSYGKCPKITNTKVCDKMTFANSAGPDQTAPEGAL